MSCQIIYNSQKYSIESFKDFLDSNKSIFLQDFISQDIEGFKKFLETQNVDLLVEKLIQSGDIQFLNENNEPCAKFGMTNTVKGTNWQLVKDFKGSPKHSQGGVDITVSSAGINMRRGGKDIKAAHGLLMLNYN
jgi:hypothetical protein